MESFISYRKRKPEARDDVGDVIWELKEDPADKGLIAMQLEVHALVNPNKKKPLNPFLTVLQHHDKKSDLEFELYSFLKDDGPKPPTLLSKVKVPIEEILGDEDGFIKAKFKSDAKAKIGSLSLTWKVIEEVPSFFDYIRGGMSIDVVIMGDSTMKKYQAKMDSLSKNITDIISHYSREDSPFHDYSPCGTTFDTMFPEVLDKVKKIDPGSAYLVFVFFTSNGQHKGMDSAAFLESSKFPLTIIILGTGKKKSYKSLDEIKEQMITQSGTDFIKKRSKQRVNFDWHFFESKTGVVEHEILRTLNQDILEYNYLNDIEAGSQEEKEKVTIHHEDVAAPPPPPAAKGKKAKKK